MIEDALATVTDAIIRTNQGFAAWFVGVIVLSLVAVVTGVLWREHRRLISMVSGLLMLALMTIMISLQNALLGQQISENPDSAVVYAYVGVGFFALILVFAIAGSGLMFQEISDWIDAKRHPNLKRFRRR